jgi:hypothetical protein
MNNDLNIIEAYLKEYDQMIILLIGMPTSNKSNIAKELESDIEPKFTLININNYLEKKFINVEAKNINFKLYDHPDNINYSKLFDDINKVKSTGVILYGNSIDPNKIKDIKVDFSYFFDIKQTFLKNNLINKKKLPFLSPKEEKVLSPKEEKVLYPKEVENNITNVNIVNKNNHHNIEKSLVNKSDTDTDTHTDSNTDSNTDTNTDSNTDSNTDTNTDSNTDDTSNKQDIKNNEDEKINAKLEIYIKDILMPMYDNIKKNIKFNKFYNIKEDTKFNDIYDNLFDNLILLIKKKLNQPLETESKSTESSTK